MRSESAWGPTDERLSRLLDRAQLDLESARDPAVVRAYRRLIDGLERIALEKGVGR